MNTKYIKRPDSLLRRGLRQTQRCLIPLCSVIFATAGLAQEEMPLALQLNNLQYGWSHSGVRTWGSRWEVRAKNEALEKIRRDVAKMVNLQQLETFTRSDIQKQIGLQGGETGSGKLDFSEGKSKEAREKWINENNYFIDVSNIRVKPGTAWTRTRVSGGPFGGRRSWRASATMLYDLRIYGKKKNNQKIEANLSGSTPAS